MQVFGDGHLRYPPPVKTASRRSFYPAHRTQSRHQSSLFPSMVAVTYSLTITVLLTTTHHISRRRPHLHIHTTYDALCSYIYNGGDIESRIVFEI